MKRWSLQAILGLTLLLVPPSLATALEMGPYSVEVLVGGRPLTEHVARSATYVEALEGREYALRITNRTPERIAVALSVDGLNSIDARRTTPREASKWIVGPHETITVEGWQTGPATARRFFFTTEEESYGAWLGQTRNLGIIAAAVFRERRPRPVPIERPIHPQSAPSKSEATGKRARASHEPVPEPESADDDLAATGIGRQLDHRVRRVRFEGEPNPVSVIRIRYEYHDSLVRLGVLPQRYSRDDDRIRRRESAHGFEGFEFSPDPYR